MEGNNNLRVKIEQLFRENSRKAFGVSEIARQFNARRNTIHYHLKILKESSFLGQNCDGEYYLAATQDNHVANKDGIANCRYHLHAQNADWCPFCGNPICERCLSTLPNGIIACMECKHEKMNSLNKIHHLGYFVGSLLLCFLIISGSNMFMNVILVAVVIYLMVKDSSWIKTNIKDRKEYFAWRRMVDDQPIPDEIIQSIIQSNEMNICKYHPTSLGINQCEICGSIICARCSRILTEFGIARLVCVKCFWKRRKLLLKIIMGYFLSILTCFLIIITVFAPEVHRNFLLFLLVFGLTPGLLCCIPLMLLSLYWVKNKRKYEKWPNGQMVTQFK